MIKFSLTFSNIRLMGSLVGQNFALQTAKKDRSLTNFYELLFEFIVQNIQFFFVESTSFYLHV